MHFVISLAPEKLFAEIEELLRTMPSWDEIGGSFEWLGRSQAVISAWDLPQSVNMDAAVRELASVSGRKREAYRQIQALLNRARYSLLLQMPSGGTKVIEKGARFDYFDEVRKIIERGRAELFFVDPYLNADFVSRYLPHVKSGTKVRLLGREKITALASAAAAMASQSGLSIEVRSGSGFHDRYLFLDGAECFNSGASFHDGGKTPTTLTPIVDAAASLRAIYESIWAGGTVY